MDRRESLFKIHQGVLICTACPLNKSRKIAVPGEGPANAKIMFVGEAPGAQEDSVGRPFVGPSGRFLNQLFERIGLDSKDVYITSTVKCRPPKNRQPGSKEIEICTTLWLNNQIKIINPKLIVLLGGIALEAFCPQYKIEKAHGQIFQIDGRKFFPTYHPSAARRFPQIRKKIYQDFDFLKILISRLV